LEIIAYAVGVGFYLYGAEFVKIPVDRAGGSGKNRTAGKD
jgi:hypothetical protein